MGSVAEETNGTQPAPTGRIDLNYALTKRPDGKHWILAQVITDTIQFAYAFPPEMAIQLIENLPKILGDLVVQANTANGGLTVASPDALKNLRNLK
jgi:hypothetical protein